MLKYVKLVTTNFSIIMHNTDNHTLQYLIPIIKIYG